jgi:hypothetical protein
MTQEGGAEDYRAASMVRLQTLAVSREKAGTCRYKVTNL